MLAWLMFQVLVTLAGQENGELTFSLASDHDASRGVNNLQLMDFYYVFQHFCGQMLNDVDLTTLSSGTSQEQLNGSL